MNRSKKQGTEAETRIVKLHKDAEIEARRLAEGGSTDEGDVEITQHAIFWAEGGYGAEFRRIVGEVKDREHLNAHDALLKAQKKAGTHRVALFWTRPEESMGGQRRVKKRLVAIPEEFWLELIGGVTTNS
jgi:hypothetical protein